MSGFSLVESGKAGESWDFYRQGVDGRQLSCDGGTLFFKKSVKKCRGYPVNPKEHGFRFIP
jgi:hypothetical protein